MDNHRTNLALFLGSDLSTHLLLNKLIPALRQSGFDPTIYLPSHKPARRAPLPELRELAFYERGILAEAIYPCLDGEPAASGAPCTSPAHLARLHGISCAQVTDINAPEFLESLARQNIHAGISIRCYQKFGGSLIRQFQQNGGILWNLHPGILPAYRGVMTIFRSLLEDQTEISYTLHSIDEAWDAGPLLDLRPIPLDRSLSMLAAYCELGPTGAPIIVENLAAWRSGDPRGGKPQDPAEARYHTFPTRQEMDAFLKKGLRLTDPGEMREIYLSRYSAPGIARNTLAERIDHVVESFRRAEQAKGGQS